MKKHIIILTGAIHSGKTTALIDWLANKKNASGIISPVIDGKRFLSLYPENDSIKLEADDSQENEILICGKYKFYKEAFAKANNYIESLDFTDLEWLVIDEAGLLELEDRGLHESMKTVLEKFIGENMRFNLIIIVRDYLVEKIIIKYNLENSVILKKEDLQNIS